MDESKYDNFLVKGSVVRGMQVDYNDVTGFDIHLTKRLPIEPLQKVTKAQHLQDLNHGLLPGGVPQGSPMSPFLSILALKRYLSQAVSSNYADDQNFFSNNDFVIRDFPEHGIVQSPEKCRWVMRNGV